MNYRSRQRGNRQDGLRRRFFLVIEFVSIRKIRGEGFPMPRQAFSRFFSG